MSSTSLRRQLTQKRKQRESAEKKLRDYQSKETGYRARASRARLAAQNTNSTSTQRSKLREAERYEKQANSLTSHIQRYLRDIGRYSTEEGRLLERLAKAEKDEAARQERDRARDQQRRDQQARAQQLILENRLRSTEAAISHVGNFSHQPRQEKLRVLMLSASPDGDLRTDREHKRIQDAVRKALHRDQIKIELRSAATVDDLLDGITSFRPHIIHFSGHSDSGQLIFEQDDDHRNAGHRVTSAAFRAAVNATDTPPILVVLNSCRSSAQLHDLVAEAVPFAIGMDGDILDGDAIAYASRFYSSIANAQSVQSAHAAGQTQLELSGLGDADLPTLVYNPSADPSTTVLVKVAT